MRATRNRVYRKLYRGFESPYLRQEFAPHLCGENLWRTYRVWTKRPQPLVAGFGTSAQSARSERGPRTKFVGITIPLSPPGICPAFMRGKFMVEISGVDEKRPQPIFVNKKSPFRRFLCHIFIHSHRHCHHRLNIFYHHI